MYDQQVSYTAIDAGADLVLGHHAHMLKGIEQYKGKVIFHGLGTFVPAIAALTEEQMSARMSLHPPSGGSDADPATKWTIIAKCVIDDGKISRVSYLPCLINEQRQPEVLKNDDRGRQVFDFIDKITKGAGLNTRYEWQDDEIVILLGKT